MVCVCRRGVPRPCALTHDHDQSGATYTSPVHDVLGDVVIPCGVDGMCVRARSSYPAQRGTRPCALTHDHDQSGATYTWPNMIFWRRRHPLRSAARVTWIVSLSGVYSNLVLSNETVCCNTCTIYALVTKSETVAWYAAIQSAGT